MTPPDRSYVPAAGHGWALPFYDPLTRLLGVDAARRALVEQAALRPAQRVLDIGCGTGRLIVLVAHLHPDVEVVGLDPDPKALARARRKVERAGVSVQLEAEASQREQELAKVRSELRIKDDGLNQLVGAKSTTEAQLRAALQQRDSLRARVETAEQNYQTAGSGRLEALRSWHEDPPG